jgi:hypothetical protein
MVEYGYDRAIFYHCVFVKKFYHVEFIILLRYVDDMLILGRDIRQNWQTEDEVTSFVMKQMSMAKPVSALLVGHFK